MPQRGTTTKSQAQKNAHDIDGFREHARLTDKCEVLVLGLPLDWEAYFEEATTKLVTTLDLRSSILRDANHRVWDQRTNQTWIGKAAETKGFVIEFDTAKHRDKFVAAMFSFPVLSRPLGFTLYGLTLYIS